MMSDRVTFAKDMRPDGGFAIEQALPEHIRHKLDRIEVPKMFADVIAQGGEDEAREMSFLLFRICLLAACIQATDIQISRATFNALALLSVRDPLEWEIADMILTDNDCIKDKGVFDYE